MGSKKETPQAKERSIKTRQKVDKWEPNLILKNLKTFVSASEDVEIVFQTLLKYGVFDEFIAYDILNEENDQARKAAMYKMVANEGPGCLAKLCSCFLEVRLSSLALRLDPSFGFLTKPHDRDENRDTEIILDNLDFLISGTEDLNLVLQKLVSKRMLDARVRAEIEGEDDNEKKIKLFKLVVKLGAPVISKLRECCKEMGWTLLLELLEKSDPSSMRNPIRIKKTVKKMTANNYQKVYKMSSFPKGFVLFINIEINTTEEEKRGMEIDVRNMMNLWKALDYKVIFKTSLTKRQFEYEVKAFSYMTELNEVDSAVIFLMSHGTRPEEVDGIFTSDKGIIRYEWITKIFEPPRCPQLLGKPKIFFFYTCRGSEGIMAKREKYSIWRTQLSDTLVIRSTTPGCCESSESANYGSCMMEGLCEVFKRFAHEEHVETMIKYVDKFLNFQNEDVANENILTFENRGFNRDLYFNPGLND